MPGAAKRGRPAKAGDRFPCGRLRPETFVSGAEWQRLRRVSRDPRLESELGRLGFLGALSPVEVACGEYIANTYGRLDAALERRRHCRSPSYEQGRRWHDSLAESVEAAERQRRALRDLALLEAEIDALAKTLLPGLRRELERLVLHDELPVAGVFPAVRAALASLAQTLGITAAMARHAPGSREARPRT